MLHVQATIDRLIGLLIDKAPNNLSDEELKEALGININESSNNISENTNAIHSTISVVAGNEEAGVGIRQNHYNNNNSLVTTNNADNSTTTDSCHDSNYIANSGDNISNNQNNTAIDPRRPSVNADRYADLFDVLHKNSSSDNVVAIASTSGSGRYIFDVPDDDMSSSFLV